MNLRVATVTLLALNLVVLAYLLVTRQSATTLPAPVADPIVIFEPAPHTPAPPAKEVVKLVTNEFSWTQLESEDYREYITRLRSIGCPEATLRDIIITDLDKLFAPQLQALRPYRTNLQYWHPEEEELLNDVNRSALLQQEQEIEKQKRAVVKELIGVDLASERLSLKGQKSYYDRRLNFLDEGKRDQVKTLLEQFHTDDWAVRSKQLSGDYQFTDADKAELQRLQQEKEAALTSLLDPAEREQFELWMSETATNVRHDTYGMKATEEEFLSIYNIRRAFDEQWQGSELTEGDPQFEAQLNLAREELDVAIMEELGQERFLEYKRGQDPEFHDLARLASQHNLTKATATEVYDQRKAYLDNREAITYSRNLSEAQKTRALEAIRAETLSAVQATLGPSAFQEYLRRSDWLR